MDYLELTLKSCNTYVVNVQSLALVKLIHYFIFPSSVQYPVVEVKLYSMSTSMEF